MNFIYTMLAMLFVALQVFANDAHAAVNFAEYGKNLNSAQVVVYLEDGQVDRDDLLMKLMAKLDFIQDSNAFDKITDKLLENYAKTKSPMVSLSRNDLRKILLNERLRPQDVAKTIQILGN
jgi:hypothetical protein